MRLCCGVKSLCQPADSTSQTGIWKEKAGRSHTRKLNVFGKGTFALGGQFLPKRAGARISAVSLSPDFTYVWLPRS